MPLKNGHMTPKERIWVDYFARTGDATYSATKAGYSSPQPRGAQNMQNDVLMHESRKLSQHIIATVAVPKAINRLIGALDDEKTTGTALNALIATTLKFGLAATDGSVAKDPSEMTPEELEKARGQLMAELAARANPPVTIDAEPIEVEPIEEPEPGVFA